MDSGGPSKHRGLSIEQLAAGAGDPLVVVDFLQLGSFQSLAEVLGEHNRDHSVYRIDPVTDLAAGGGAYRPLDWLAAGYAQACTGEGLAGRRLAVAGYCSAAALSLLLAHRLAGQATVSSVLVQPTWPDARSIAADFGGFRANLGANGDRPPGPQAGPDAPHGADLLRDAGASPEATLEWMRGVLRRDLEALAETRGLDAAGPALADLLARYQAWLGFLLASRDALRRPWPPETQPCLLAGVDADAYIPSLGSGSYRTVRLPVPERASLQDAAFADSVLAHAWSRGGQPAPDGQPAGAE